MRAGDCLCGLEADAKSRDPLDWTSRSSHAWPQTRRKGAHTGDAGGPPSRAQPGLRRSSVPRDSRWVLAASGAPWTLSRVGNPSPKQVSLSSKHPADLGRPVFGFWRSKPPVPSFCGVPRAWVARNRDLHPANPHGRAIRSSTCLAVCRGFNIAGASTGGTSQLLSRSWRVKNK